jgi:hypothetical protein
MRDFPRNFAWFLSRIAKSKLKTVLSLLLLALLASPSMMLAGAATATGPFYGTRELVHDVAVTNIAPMNLGLALNVANDSTVDVSVTVLNTGDFTETFDVGAYGNSTNLAPNQTVTSLGSGAQTILVFIWNTNGWSLGAYVLSAVAYLPGDPTPSDNSLVYPFGLIHVITEEAAYQLQHQNTTLFTDPSTIQSTSIGQDFNVAIEISNVYSLWEWSAGVAFNSSILKCTGFYEGDFLKSAEFTSFSTMIYSNPNNQLQNMQLAADDFLEDLNVAGVTGSGQLAYLTFTSIGIGVSDIQLIDTYLMGGGLASSAETYIPSEVIENFTVPVNGTNFGVQIAHNITEVNRPTSPSGVFNTVFSAYGKNISFDVLAMKDWFLQISVPKKLLMCNVASQWAVKVDGVPVPYTATETAAYTVLSFQQDEGNHTVEIIGTNVLGLNPSPAQSLAPPSLLVAIAASLCIVTLLVALVDLKKTRSFRALKEFPHAPLKHIHQDVMKNHEQSLTTNA